MNEVQRCSMKVGIWERQMLKYDNPDLYRNRPVIVLAFYFQQEGLVLNKKLIDLSARIAEWLNIEWHKFAVAFEREDVPIRNFYEYKRTSKRWTQLLCLMETEAIETFGVNSYGTNKAGEECVVALNIDFRSVFDKPHICFLRLVPDILESGHIRQTGKWLLPFVTLATEIFRPLYGFVHIGDQGLNWYLYASGAEDSSFPVEGSVETDVLNSVEILHTRVPRVYWGNLLSTEHIRQLKNVGELRAWELGSREWQVYHNAVPSEGFRRSKNIPLAKSGTRADWPVQVHRLGEGHVFFTLTPDPLDWSPNVGIGGLIKAEYRRITDLFKSKSLIV